MSDWRRIESKLADFFDRAGLKTQRGGGDFIVEVGPVRCPLIMAGVCEGKADGGGEINVTQLARELTDILHSAA
jgi:hypothetical protein